MLLKAFKPTVSLVYSFKLNLCFKFCFSFPPQHPLFTLESQTLSVCLSYTQINQLRRVSSAYISKAIEVCGQPVTVKQIYQERQKAKEDFYRFAEASSRINIEKWRG
jgi:hypothetical protein